jgi:hypothetical protein
MRRKKPHPADIYAAAQAARAVAFTVFRFRGRENRTREEHKTLAAARASAAGDRNALIYAITPEGLTVHVPDFVPSEPAR